MASTEPGILRDRRTSCYPWRVRGAGQYDGFNSKSTKVDLLTVTVRSMLS